MATYLLLWNPKRWSRRRRIEDVFEKRRGALYTTWSSGRCRRIVPGDRLFLAHIGAEPRGIVASGVATSFAEEGRHWDPMLAKLKRTAVYVDGRFEIAIDPSREPIVTFAQLERSGIHFRWSQRASGVELPFDVAVGLERVWRRLTGCVASIPHVESSAIEGVKTETIGYTRGRSRTLRDAALASARGICEACGVDYSRLLNGRGTKVLQVHHRKQLSVTDRPVVTRVRDLAVLCANCHMLVHMHPKRAMAVHRLRRLLRG